MTKQLLTLRQFLFLRWLFSRRVESRFCDLTNTDIQCYNCLNRNKECKKGLIPASFFSKKIGRQYYDCKRVLDALKKKGYISEIHLDAKIFHVFYRIEDKGIKFLQEFEINFWIRN